MSNKSEKQIFEETMTKRFFFIPAYEIYGGVKGLYDYGPPGSAIMANIIHFWRQHFIIEENMLEISTTSLTPEIVFQVSGHCAKFQDYMVKDVSEPKFCYRADHLLKEKINQLLSDPNLSQEERARMEDDKDRLDDYTQEQLGAKIREYGCVSPDTGNEVSDPFPFNLMFGTQIGPTGKYQGFLRPETAQGMFVNFPRLLEYNNGKLPFAAAQIGPAFRNEIAPRSGLLRVREFTLAEIEHFVDPEDKSHPKFHKVASYVLPLYARDNQLGDKQILKLEIGTAVRDGIVDNETLGYFLVRVHQFLRAIGIKEENIRFRQHLPNEMAHYASDCWDAEIKSSYGWVECVGNADRACYDLGVHAKASGRNMTAFVNYKDGPREEELIEVVVNKGIIGRTFKNAAKDFLNFIEEIRDNQEELVNLEKSFGSNNAVVIHGIEVTKDMIQFNRVRKNVVGKRIRPSVIEPSFGLGRILYSLLEQSFSTRTGNDGARNVLAVAPFIAPIQCAVFPLLSNERFEPLVDEISALLKRSRISNQIDSSGVSIGRRYARVDEIGCPFCITVDFTTLENNTVTIRERDSTEQIRIEIAQVPSILLALIHNDTTWDNVKEKFPVVQVVE